MFPPLGEMSKALLPSCFGSSTPIVCLHHYRKRYASGVLRL